jgi:hypothetical protein
MIDEKDRRWLERCAGKEGVLFYRLEIATAVMCFAFGLIYLGVAAWGADLVGVRPGRVVELWVGGIKLEKTYSGFLISLFEKLQMGVLFLGAGLISLVMATDYGKEVARSKRLIAALKAADAWPPDPSGNVE